ncbi:MAG TPA: hypothetical protein VM884_05070 [Flavisolibacter sp.]|nr:hypothetical protein [Flavisolibacter sp.]
MILSNKKLGAIAVAAAPFLSFQTLNGQAANAGNTSVGGFFDLIYMVGWMCSIVGLIRLQAIGTGKRSSVLLYIQLGLLCVANCWNVWVIFDPSNNSTLFRVLDLFWPLSNVNMLVIGIAVALKGKLQGWRRYVVLLVGLWLPVALGSSVLLGRDNPAGYYPGCVYSAIAWALLGWMIYISGPEEQKGPQLAL